MGPRLDSETRIPGREGGGGEAGVSIGHRSMYNDGAETGGTVAVPGALQSQRSKIGVLWEQGA